MITNIEITGINYTVDDTTRRYIMRKLARLDRFLPRHARKTVAAETRLKQIDQKHGNKYEVEVTLQVPDKVLVGRDSTGNILAAFDIVEAKIMAQLRKYKEASLPHVGRRGLMSRFKRSYAREL